MASFTVEIPDYLLPALVAEFSLVQGKVPAATPEEYFKASVVEIIRQRAEIYKVGPYFVGAVDPQFNQDGTPYGWAPPPEPEPEWDWPEAPVRFEPFTAPDGSEWIYDQPRAADGAYAQDDPATEAVESAMRWVRVTEDDGGGGGDG
jgi:hypothetical protein